MIQVLARMFKMLRSSLQTGISFLKEHICPHGNTYCTNVKFSLIQGGNHPGQTCFHRFIESSNIGESDGSKHRYQTIGSPTCFTGV